MPHTMVMGTMVGCQVWVQKDAMRMHLGLERPWASTQHLPEPVFPRTPLTLGGPADVVPLYQQVPRALREAVQQQELEGGRNNHH